MAGGDSGSANMFNAAVFGAIDGLAGIPDSWKQKTTHYDEVLASARAWLAM
jgi:hypothetical protein